MILLFILEWQHTYQLTILYACLSQYVNIVNEFSAGITRGKYREDPCSEKENVIERYFTESGCVGVNWIHLA